MTLTVSICTYSRCASLRQTLESLTHLDVPAGLEWELLIVDNNSHDPTRSVVEEFVGRLPIRYIFEPQQGLSHARNRAVRELQGDLLLFTDDDVKVDPGWLKEMWQGAQCYPHAAFFGGKILPWWQCEPPAWMDLENIPELHGVVLYYDLGNEQCFYDESRVLPYGANFAVRRTAFNGATPFRPDLGVQGTKRMLGEETDFLMRLMEEGVAGVYLPSAIVHHFVPSYRCTKQYVWKWYVGFGRSRARREYRMQQHGRRRKQVHLSLWRWALGAGVWYFRALLSGRARYDVKPLTTFAWRWGYLQEARVMERERRQPHE